MESIFTPDLTDSQTEIAVSGDELNHTNVLRLKTGENILVTNGQGLSAITSLTYITKHSASLSIEKFLYNSGELPYPLGLAIGILDTRDRFEFALEKSIELGITDFFPLITDFTQKKIIQKERLESKAVSALKQSKRSCLTTIHHPCSLDTLIKKYNKYDNLILTDYSGAKPTFTKALKSSLILVGPEGGFSDKEIDLIKNQKNIKSYNIADRRLRAETAAILAVGLIALNMKE